ncbi:MAG TPA: site-specific integrase [Streptosporangiaceae bacterium]
MGFSRRRPGKDGRPRYTAYYCDLCGSERSAGTFPNKKDADKAWQRAEAKVAEGRLGDPSRGRQTFQTYVETTWLPNHEVEATTRQSYTYSIYKHLMPTFGPMRMMNILPEHVRAWVTALKDSGVTPVTIKYNKVLLSAIFTTALNDQVVFIHPCKGVKTPTVAQKPRTIITPEQFGRVLDALPDDRMRLLAETKIETGLRWGELTELRPRDIDFATRMLTVSRAVVEVNAKFHPRGGRFLVKDYPKDREYRRIKLTSRIAAKLQVYVHQHDLADDDLIFSMPTPVPVLTVLPNPDQLGRTEPNAGGRTYQHGTLSAYTAGSCRCVHCKNAFAQYRARRRAAGKDDPRTPRSRDTDGHIPRDWFRNQIWRPALAEAGVTAIRPHGLRHAHASWLLAGGADLQSVKERLGHASIVTTEKYLHTLPDADDSTLDAFTKIRDRAVTTEA